MMRIIIAPDSFKNSRSAVGVANSIEKGIKKVFNEAEIVKIPIADGGEGTVEAILIGAGGSYEKVSTYNPLGKEIISQYGIVGGHTAIIEMAEASGLQLVREEERNPMITTTYGTGQLIKSALDKGLRKIVLGIGGSATNDGGLGMASALGVKFLDDKGEEVPLCGTGLIKVKNIDMTGIDPRIVQTEFIVACDVKNPLCGKTGATHVYGKQKGATPEMIESLEWGMSNYAKVLENKLGKEIQDQEGAGAAGGLGAALLAFCNAKLRSGIETVLDVVGIDQYLVSTDLIITGEGNMDAQSIYGKVPIGLAKRAKKYNIPVVAIVGGIGEGAQKTYEYGIDSIMTIVNRPMSLEHAMADVDELLEDAAERTMRMIKVGMALNNY